MSRAIIVCGAKIKDYEFVSSFFKKDDYFIYCDSGLIHENRFMSEVDTSADLIIGDFDSHDNPLRNVETIVLPHEKDDTDSVYAMKEALKRGYKEILFVGAVGDRFDHSLVNIYALQYILDNGAKGSIVDDLSVMELIDKNNPGAVSDVWPYFSLVAISGEASGVTIQDAKYELEDAVITPSYQFATSNEPVKDKTTKITVADGYLLLIKDRYL